MELTQLPDETALAGQEHLDPAYVAGYERKAGVEDAEDLAELRQRGLEPGSTLIDFGAGTGGLAVVAASLCERVIAVDASPAMVAAARAKVTELGISNVDCVSAGFLSYQHTGERVDFIYSRNALHHLPDFWKAIALRRMADLLRPGGVLNLRDLVFAFGSDESERYIGEWLHTGAELPEDGWTRTELEAHLRDEFSTFTWLLEPMIERAGLEIVRADYGSVKVYADYTCIKVS
jgi:cyclopropane fatty-acyl-phospholipid synthase-like methyltransferase